MLLTIFFFFSSVLLVTTLVQDVRDRAVSIAVFPLLLLCLATQAVLKQPVLVVLEAWGQNMAFLGVQLTILYLYFLLTRRRPVAVVGTVLGLGDLLFWLTIAVFFSLPNFVMFFFVSLVLSLFLHFALRFSLRHSYHNTVPLAGFQALALLVLLVMQQLYKQTDFYGDSFVERLLL